jgi:endothelin-converting enzyme/putative endopeptidase
MGRIRSHTIAELDVFPDAKNPGVNGIELSQHTDVMTEGVVGLSNPDVYRGDTSEARERLAAYRAYITETLAKAGIDRPAERASAIIALETKLAEHMWRPEKLRDREANYHKMSYAELQDYAAGFPWEELYRARGLPIGRDLVLGTDTAVKTSARIFAETSVDDWSSYLAYHWIDNHWSLLPAEFSGPGFEFHIAEPYGVEARTSLAERAAGFVEKHLGREVGRVYVEQYFSERDRARAEMMVGYIREAFREKIEGADWMDESTRQQALRKLANVRVNIGYPRKWRDYSGVRIEPDQRIGNHARLLEADWERRAGLLGKPFPDGEWVWGYAYHVDAAITPQLNTITFPAAIIERSMGRGVDPAAAFGEIGIIIGHEMGHAFDDQGASFDSTGRIRDWWSPGTRAAFEKQTRRIAEQYSQFEALPGLNLSGERAQGEAIADLIGYSVALRGYELFAEDHYPGGQAPVIDGLSWRERFFLASAQGQRTVWTDEALRQQVENGYHPPGEMRVNGSVRNIGAWYETFDVKPFDDLYIKPEQRVSLW